jgi:hypothetical protein
MNWVKILKFFDADLESGMEKIRIRAGIRNGKTSDPDSGINIPDPQHWYIQNSFLHMGGGGGGKLYLVNPLLDFSYQLS